MESACFFFFISSRGNVRKEMVSSRYLHSSTLMFWSSLGSPDHHTTDLLATFSLEAFFLFLRFISLVCVPWTQLSVPLSTERGRLSSGLREEETQENMVDRWSSVGASTPSPSPRTNLCFYGTFLTNCELPGFHPEA